METLNLNFFILPNPSGRTRSWGLLSLWQKWVPEQKKFLSSKVCPVHRADNLTAMWDDCLGNVGASTSHNLMALYGLLEG
jgi:hypothetical protein